MTVDEMAGWHHQLDGHEFEQAPGVGDRQRSLACCSLWGGKELDMNLETEQQTKLILLILDDEEAKLKRLSNLFKVKFGYGTSLVRSLSDILIYGSILFWEGSKITADGDCSHEIKRHFLLGRKGMTNLDSILKSTDITLPTKAHLVKTMVFLVVMYGCESWTIMKAERQRIDALNCGVGEDS